jgi:hypothetical protein
MSHPANWLPWQTPGGRIIWAECIEPNFSIENQVTIPLLGDSGLLVMAEYVRERIDHNFDCLVMVSGDRGSGKSTLILQCALEIDPRFSAEQIAFRPSDFAKVFQANDKTKRKYRQLVADESGHAFHSRRWNNSFQTTIIRHMIISRVKKQVIWQAVPKRSQLDNQLRDMPYIWVHVSQPTEFVQGFAIVLTAPSPLQSMWHPERYWVHQFAFTFQPLAGDLWDEYEKRKIAFVDEETEAIITGKISKADRTVEAWVRYLHDTLNMSFPKIVKIPGTDYSHTALQTIYKKNPNH